MLRQTLAAIIIAVGFTCLSLGARAETYYIATDGVDTNNGSLEQPFASIMRAQEAAEPGDTIYIRGGTYRILESQIASKQRIWAHVIQLNKSGSWDKRINYWAYEDEHPVFDFSNVKPHRMRVHAFSVSGSWLHLRGIEVVGVQVTIPTHTQSICFANDGSHNIYERLSMHDGMAIGIYSLRGSDNLFLNCDAYRNHDSFSEGGRGGNTDGFGCHPTNGGTGNVFRGCRAWFNSDDGFDCISASEAVTFENCWAFNNGYSSDFKSLGDGNGFKAGGYGSLRPSRLPEPIPRHVVKDCIAAHNKSSGFYANHHIGGCDWLGNSAYRNGTNFNMLGRESDNVTDVPGYGHVLRDNISYRSRRLVGNLNRQRSEVTNNSFDFDVPLTDSDFISLDESQLTQARQPDGNLPEITFLRLKTDEKSFGKKNAAQVEAFDLQLTDQHYNDKLGYGLEPDNLTIATKGGAWASDKPSCFSTKVAEGLVLGPVPTGL